MTLPSGDPKETTEERLGVHCVASQDDRAAINLLLLSRSGGRLSGPSVSFVDGARSYFPNLSVRENLSLGARSWGQVQPIRPVSLRRIAELGVDVSGGDLAVETPDEMTRAIICTERALCEEAPYLRVHRVVDRLTDEGANAFIGMVKERNRRGIDVAFSLGKFRAAAMAQADWLTILRSGQVVYEGAPNQVSELRSHLLMLDRSEAREHVRGEITARTSNVLTVDGLLSEWGLTLREVLGERAFAIRADMVGSSPHVATGPGAPPELAHDLANWLTENALEEHSSVVIDTRRFRLHRLISDSGEFGVLLVQDSTEPAVLDSADLVLTLSNSFTDFQERRRSLQASRDLSRAEAVTTLVGGIAHDLNNRLQIMIGSLDLIDRNSDRDEVDAHLDTVRIIANDSRVFVSKLLAFSRVAHFDSQPMSMHAVLRDAAEIVGRGTPRVQILVREGHTDPIIEGDPVELRNVFVNLMLNSARAVPQHGGRIELRPRINDGQTVSVAVIDNGHGIPSKFVDRIFQPFVSGGSAPLRTGLGLAVARSIVEEHGGHIQIRSTSAAGTTVVVTLPMSPLTYTGEGGERPTSDEGPVEPGHSADSNWISPQGDVLGLTEAQDDQPEHLDIEIDPEASPRAAFGSTEPQHAGPRPTEPGEHPHPGEAGVYAERDVDRRPSRPRLRGVAQGSSGKVLVCDDDPDVLAVLEDMLRFSGFQVVAARSGPEALAAVRQDPDSFGVAIVDQVMEGMAGDVVIAELRVIRAELPTISLSGYRASDGELPEVGADLMLMKPVTMDQLVHAVQALVEGAPDEA